MTAADHSRAAPRRGMSLALAGSGGAGILTAGELLLRAAARAGLYGLLTRSVGPQIRGGESAALLRVAHEPVQTHDDAFHLLLVIDWRNFDRFAGEIDLREDALVIMDESAGEVPRAVRARGARVEVLPLVKLAREVGGRANMVAVGLAGHFLGLGEDELADIIRWHFTARGKEAAIAPSIAAMRVGLARAATCGDTPRPLAGVSDSARRAAARGERWLISGNEAVALGFVAAGGRFAAGYPITPASDLLEWLAPRLAALGGRMVQVEDEIAAINFGLGASHGGVPAMTATSGPGLSLMIEGLGLAVMAEIPFLLVDVQRVGPSTGIPTKSEQGDLALALAAAHGDAPHLVLAADSVADAVHTTAWALHLAERLQCPAILLSDQKLAQMKTVVDAVAAPPWRAARETVAACGEEGYRRHALTPSGVSPVALPGTPGCMHTVDGLEHDERALPSSRVEDHLAMLEKRRRKLDQLAEWPDEEMAHWADVGGKGALAIITWGSSAGPVREAARLARAEGMEVRHVVLRLISPPQKARLAAALEGVERLLVVENDHGGQFLRHLRAHHDLPDIVVSCRRPGPKPITARQVLRGLRFAATARKSLTERTCA